MPASLPTPERPWIIVPLLGATPDRVAAEVGALADLPVDAVELRVDSVADAAAWPAALATARSAGLPVLATLRTELTPWSGEYAGLVRRLLDLGPDLLDVEAAHPAAPDLVDAARSAGAVPVVSRHDAAMPADVSGLLRALRRVAGPDGIAKLAVTPRNAADLEALAQAGRSAVREGRCIVIGMGEAGARSRTAPGDFGSCATFATVGAASAPGQLPAAQVAAALGR